jgi:hypothetical protein
MGPAKRNRVYALILLGQVGQVELVTNEEMDSVLAQFGYRYHDGDVVDQARDSEFSRPVSTQLELEGS